MPAAGRGYNASMVETGRRHAFFGTAAVAVIVVLFAGPAWSQPPVAKPQPPPKAPPAGTAAATPAPAKPATVPSPAGAQPVQPAGGDVAPASRAPANPATPAPVTPSAPTPAIVSVAPAGDQPPTEAQLGVPVLPNAQYLGSYDAGGAGQRFYLYGTVQRFADVVAYYRTVLRAKGDLVFEFPPTHMFEVGRFKDDQVAFPPGVTVKDYTFGGSPGLANPRPGATPVAFPTVIQIVPAATLPLGRSR